MKRLIRVLVLLLVFLVSTICLFYWWAAQSNLPAAQHTTVKQRTIAGSQVDTLANEGLFSIMTYNIGYLSGMTNNEAVTRDTALFIQNLSRAKALVHRLSPNLLCLQEIDYGSRRSYGQDQEEVLANDVFPFVARAVNWDKRYVAFPYWPPTMHFGKIISGQSILTRFPILDHRVDTLAQMASAPFYYREFYLNRLAQTVRVAVGEREVVVINVHLEAFDRETRRQHTDSVFRIFQRYSANYPTIVLGDFNSSPDEADATITPFLTHGIGKVALEEADYQRTYPSDRPTSRLDYIFYNDSLEVVDGRVINEAGTVSDHLPVWALFRFKN